MGTLYFSFWDGIRMWNKAVDMSPGDGKGPPEFRSILRVSFGLIKTGPDRYSVRAQPKPCFYSPWQVRFLVCSWRPLVSFPSLTSVEGIKVLAMPCRRWRSLRVHRVFFIISQCFRSYRSKRIAMLDVVRKGSTRWDDLRFSVCTSGTSVTDFLSSLMIWLRPKVVVSSDFDYLNLPATSFMEVFHSSFCLGRNSLKSCYQRFAESFYVSELTKLDSYYLKGTFRISHFLFKQSLAFTVELIACFWNWKMNIDFFSSIQNTEVIYNNVNDAIDKFKVYIFFSLLCFWKLTFVTFRS